MNNHKVPYFFLFTLMTGLSMAQGAPAVTPTAVPSPSPTITSGTMGPTATPDSAQAAFEEKKRELELQRLELENEKLKLEMEQLKAQVTKTDKNGNSSSDQEAQKAVEGFQREMSSKAEGLSKANKDKADLLVLDLVNSEAWYKGTRYSIHDLFSMAEDQKLKMSTTLDKRGPAGDARYLYRIQNTSLLRYDGRTRGIVDFKAPTKEGDFKILTSEGVSFDSTIGDVRNAYQSVYFKYTGESHHNGLKWLKYRHPDDFFTFADRLEFGFNKDGKLAEIRYGVLDEN